ncbi:FAD binding domain-containing protein [Suillus discolor]|uniref:FAD binding domain-containing protein n=1 Tax=Suillus discolor TaxID=1912936 RepID=A0A9P7F232_9AGAM|nr:FAD binding domain-containing protein [Suillus discolor]KAG2103083.1 FAD binding domain-containing protein [Suillus discolor]
MFKESHVDVLIIGAGPSGLMCANALAGAGVDFRIIDNRPVGVAAGQADGIQPRTIEVLQSYGLAEPLLKDGAQMHLCAFYNPGPDGGIERTGRAADVTAPTARYPFKITIAQASIEALFVESLKSQGISVDRPIVPSSLEISQDPAELLDPSSYPVKVVLDHIHSSDDAPEQEIVHAKFVVGADGAHSWVRKTLGFTMDGEQTDYIWGVIDFIPDTDFPDIRNRAAIHSENGSCMIIPREGDKVRFYLQMADKDVMDPATGRIDKQKVTAENLINTARRTFYPYVVNEPKEVDWCSIYIIGQRVASKFSKHDRVFIAGDACHTHSPKAGQGMNASMNDTHNLAWKLAQVLRGRADISLLKTYELERQKYAQDLIDFDREFSALFSGKPRTLENQEGVTHEEFLSAFQAFGGFSSGIGVHYMPSAIVDAIHQGCAPNIIIGERMLPQIFVRAADARPMELQDMLPADTRFKLLFFVGLLTSEQLTKVRRLAEELELPTSFLQKYGSPAQGKAQSTFDIISIAAGHKDDVNFLDIPSTLRTHWSKVLIDDTDVTGRLGGGAYPRFGIDEKEITIVVVRPDGYVGMIAPSTELESMDKYFGSFLIGKTLNREA